MAVRRISWRSAQPPEDRSQLRNTILIDPIPISPKTSGGQSEYYGTRLATVILVKRDGSVTFVERDVWKLGHNHDPIKGISDEQRTFQFTVTMG
jgi:uncharacterized protein with NRDE domain